MQDQYNSITPAWRPIALAVNSYMQLSSSCKNKFMVCWVKKERSSRFPAVLLYFQQENVESSEMFTFATNETGQSIKFKIKLLLWLRALRASGKKRKHRPFGFFYFSKAFLKFISWSIFILEISSWSWMQKASCACQSFLITFDAQSLWKLKLKIITLIFSTGTYYFIL